VVGDFTIVDLNTGYYQIPMNSIFDMNLVPQYLRDIKMNIKFSALIE